MIYRILDAYEFGLIDHWIDEALKIPGTDKCFETKPRKAKDVPIKLVDLTGAFLILGIGLGVSTLSFLLELIVAKYRHEMTPPRTNASVERKGANSRFKSIEKRVEPAMNTIVKPQELIEEDLEESEVIELK